MARLLLPYTPRGVVPDDRQRRTFEFIRRNYVELIDGGIQPTPFKDQGYTEYEREFVHAINSRAKFGLLEHDVLPDLGHVLDLFNCPHPLCAVPVESHLDHKGGPYNIGPCSAHGCDGPPEILVHRGGNIYERATVADNWADTSGTGLLKFGEAFLRKLPDPFVLPPGRSDLDGRLWSALRAAGVRYRIHVHWPSNGRPIAHYHWKCLGDL